MCGGGSSPQAQKPTPPPTQNLVPVEPTQGTEQRTRVKRLNAKGQQSGGATLLTGGIQ